MKKLFILILLSFLGSIHGWSQSYGNEWIDFSKTYYKFPVRDVRFFRIPLSTLNANGLGTVPVEHFQLWRDGKEVPMFTTVENGLLPLTGYLEFFGTRNTGFDDRELFASPNHYTNPERSFFSDTAWYFLTVNTTGNNKRFVRANNPVAVTTLPADSFYMETINPIAATNSFNFGFSRVVGSDFIRSSNWDEGEGFASNFFASVRTTDLTATALRAFMNGPQASIIYTIAGATINIRRASLRINNVPFDSVLVPYFASRTRNIMGLNLAQNIVGDAINFKFNSNNTASNENVTVNQLKFSYPRQLFNNLQNPLQITLPANNLGNHLRIQGLPNGNIQPVLYDLTQLKRYTGIIKPDSSLFVIDPSAEERTLVIGTQVISHVRNITSFKKVNFVDFSNPANQSDYLILSHFLLMGGTINQVEEYANYRRSFPGGDYNAKVYNIDDIAEQFAYGNRKHPLAIRRFIRYALDQFPVKPKMVLLIGRGTNFFSNLRNGSSLREILNAVPTYGFPASDNLLVSRNNLRPVPEIPIGRISAISPNEVMIYLEKIKEYEALQQKRPFLPSDNEWRKRFINLIGGDDEYLADSILTRFMNIYKNIIESPRIGGIVTQYSRPGNLNLASDMKEIETRVNEGTGVITYFGHSSTSSIDFNLGSPRQFINTGGKYPVFMANGCRAGNIFDANNGRINATEISISENFTLARKSGSIAFISNSDLGAINYQNLLTTEWYRAAAGTKYSATIGEIQLEALTNAFNRTGSSDFMNRCNVEQNILHGDPAIKIFTTELPDYAVETLNITTVPSKIFTNADSAIIKVSYTNLGSPVNDSVYLHISRDLPDGTSKILYNRKVFAFKSIDSLEFKIGIKGLFEEGQNYIIARMDPNNDWVERDKDNNAASLPFAIDRKYIDPVFPYNYAIVNRTDIGLTAVTTNPIATAAMYRFEIDTTSLFNSSLLQQKDTVSQGGTITWQPDGSLLPNTVYYWRTYQSGPTVPGYASVFSFTVLPGLKTGFNQGHYFQHKNNTGRVILDSARNFGFGLLQNNLFVSHGIYPSSGTEDNHFAITHKGDTKIRSACLGRSIIFNVFDPNSFEPWVNNPGRRYLSANYCKPGTEYNFEFSYFPASNRKRIMDFLDSIPQGTFVTARMILDPPFDSSQSRFWKNDTLIFGKGKSLFHSLYNQGFYDLDSLNKPRTFFFMFKKDDSLGFKPSSQMSNGLLDRLFVSIFPETTDTLATVLSPWMGPAQKWDEAHWKLKVFTTDVLNPTSLIKLWGQTPTGQKALLGSWSGMQDQIDISAFDAAAYPFMQFEMVSSNHYGFHPAQIDYWRLYYKPLPDGAISGNDLFTSNFQSLKPGDNELQMQLAFKNISTEWLDSTRAYITLTDESGNKTPIYSTTLRSVAAGDTVILNMNTRISIPAGAYQMRIDINNGNSPREQQLFNNLATLQFTINGSPLPLRLLQFDAQKKVDKVDLTWRVTEAESLQKFEIEHSAQGTAFTQIGSVSANNLSSGDFTYSHSNPANGTNSYRLKIFSKDGTSTYSIIRNVDFSKGTGVRMLPNPFNQYFTLQPNDASATWQVKIMDANGRVVHADKGTGSKRIELNGKAAGILWVEWQTASQKEIIKMIKQ